MIVYTDGSTHPTNPGPGGFGCVFLNDNHELLFTYSKQTKEITTNNREEMKAILYAICRSVLEGDTNIHIYADSAYAINSFSQWIHSWKRNGWKTSKNLIPENIDLIKAYDNLPKNISITYHKVKGHSNNKFNELADSLAKGNS